MAYYWVFAKKIEYLDRNCDLATIFKVLMENTMGKKVQNLENAFSTWKYINMSHKTYQEKQNCNILGGKFSKIFALSSYFNEKTEIFDLCNCIGAPL